MVREVRMHRPSRPGRSAAADLETAGSDPLGSWEEPHDRAAWDDLLDCDGLDDGGHEDDE